MKFIKKKENKIMKIKLNSQKKINKANQRTTKLVTLNAKYIYIIYYKEKNIQVFQIQTVKIMS